MDIGAIGMKRANNTAKINDILGTKIVDGPIPQSYKRDFDAGVMIAQQSERELTIIEALAEKIQALEARIAELEQKGAKR
jgi:hypothetical protein